MYHRTWKRLRFFFSSELESRWGSLLPSPLSSILEREGKADHFGGRKQWQNAFATYCQNGQFLKLIFVSGGERVGCSGSRAFHHPKESRPLLHLQRGRLGLTVWELMHSFPQNVTAFPAIMWIIVQDLIYTQQIRSWSQSLRGCAGRLSGWPPGT